MTHDVAELLPFYANGTLDADERARVEAELAACAQCAGELAELRRLGAALRARAAAAPAPQPRVLADALDRIDASPAYDGAVPARSRDAVTRLRTAWWGAPARYATAAALVLGVGAAAVAGYHARYGSTTTAGSPDAANGTGADGTTAVIFRYSPGPAMKRPAGRSATTAAQAHRLTHDSRITVGVRDVTASLTAAQAIIRAGGGDVRSAFAGPAMPLDATRLQTTGSRLLRAPAGGAVVDATVPQARLNDLLDRLGGMGTVVGRAIDADDLEPTLRFQETRLRELRRDEDAARAALAAAKAADDDTRYAASQRLADVRAASASFAAAHLREAHRVTTSGLTVTLVTVHAAHATPR